jgi:hypothetical protein
MQPTPPTHRWIGRQIVLIAQIMIGIGAALACWDWLDYLAYAADERKFDATFPIVT